MVYICEKEDLMTQKITQVPCSWKMRYVPLGCFRNWSGCAYGRFWGIKSKLILKFFISKKSISVAACLHKIPRKLFHQDSFQWAQSHRQATQRPVQQWFKIAHCYPTLKQTLPSPTWYQFCIYAKFKNYSVLETFIEIAKEAMQCETV